MRTVPLYGGIAAGRVALVDDADYDLVMQHRWSVLERIRPGRLTEGPYAIANIPTRWGPKNPLAMHKLLVDWPLVDHINHNGLDNRRENIRPATRSQNLANQRKRPGCTSQYKGVFLIKTSGRWNAGIKINGKRTGLGIFAVEEDAARAYDAAARELFGEYAYLNFPDHRQLQ